MPNFDGTGPLKRGRVIGRGRGPCGKQAVCDPGNTNEQDRTQKKTSAR